MKNLTETVYAEIYEDIISGKLAPGSKLAIQKLMTAYEAGMSPIREALSMLVATELVQPLHQRGFSVAPISKEDLQDVYSTRCIIETESISLAMEKGTDTWEANIIAAYYKLSKYESDMLLRNPQDYSTWERYHYAFYKALSDACPWQYLKNIQQKLYVLTERYRRQWMLLSLQTTQNAILSQKQKPMMDCILERNKKQLGPMLQEYFFQAQAMIATSTLFDAVQTPPVKVEKLSF